MIKIKIGQYWSGIINIQPNLAKFCGIDIDGVAIGSYARKIVKKYTQRNDFYENDVIFEKALSIATDLVNSVIS